MCHRLVVMPQPCAPGAADIYAAQPARSGVWLILNVTSDANAGWLSQDGWDWAKKHV